jgi:hypothetical protein
MNSRCVFKHFKQKPLQITGNRKFCLKNLKISTIKQLHVKWFIQLKQTFLLLNTMGINRDRSAEKSNEISHPDSKFIL